MINTADVLLSLARLSADDLAEVSACAEGRGRSAHAAHELILTAQRHREHSSGRGLCELWARAERWRASTGASCGAPALSAEQLRHARSTAQSDDDFVHRCLDPRGPFGAGLRRIAADVVLAVCEPGRSADASRAAPEIIQEAARQRALADFAALARDAVPAAQGVLAGPDEDGQLFLYALADQEGRPLWARLDPEPAAFVAILPRLQRLLEKALYRRAPAAGQGLHLLAFPSRTADDGSACSDDARSR